MHWNVPQDRESQLNGIAAQRHAAPEQPISIQRGPEPRLKSSSALHVGLRNHISLFVDDLRVGYHDSAVRILHKGVDEGIALSGQPNVILVAQEHDAMCCCGQRALECPQDAQAFVVP
jgi:hypothetical protein